MLFTLVPPIPQPPIIFTDITTIRDVDAINAAPTTEHVTASRNSKGKGKSIETEAAEERLDKLATPTINTAIKYDKYYQGERQAKLVR